MFKYLCAVCLFLWTIPVFPAGYSTDAVSKKIPFERVEGYTLAQNQELKATNYVVIDSVKHWQQWFRVDVPKKASLIDFQKNRLLVIVKYDNTEWQLKPRWIYDMDNQWTVEYSSRIVGRSSLHKKASVLIMMVKKTHFPKLIFLENGLFVKEIRGKKK